MDRRGFLGAMLALGAAPAIVRADSLMRIVVPREAALILWGDGIHDDTVALQTFVDGGRVVRPDGLALAGVLSAGSFLVSSTINMDKARDVAIRDSSFIGRGLDYSPMFEWKKQAPAMPVFDGVCFTLEGAKRFDITNRIERRGPA